MSAVVGPLLRMLVSLAVVLALMYIAARLLNRTHGTPRSVQRPHRPRRRLPGVAAVPRRTELEVVGHRPLGKGAAVALVRAADRTWLVGVTDTSVRLLSELEPDAEAIPDDAGRVSVAELVPGGAAPVSLLDQLRERTVRRA